MRRLVPLLTVCAGLSCALGALNVAAATASVSWEAGEEVEGGIEWKAVPSSFATVGKTVSSEKGLEFCSAGVCVRVEETTEGVVGPSGEGEVTKITPTKTEGCESTSAKPLHLPWHTQLVEVGEKLKSEQTSAGSGNPGWEVACTVLGIKATEKCTLAKATSALEYLESSHAVESDYNSETEEATCEGGLGSKGTVRHSVDLSAKSGVPLRAVADLRFKGPTNGEISPGNVETGTTVEHKFEFTESNKEFVKCKQVEYTWALQAVSATFEVTPKFKATCVSGAGEAVTVVPAASCRYQFIKPVDVGRFSSKFSLAGTGCTVVLTWSAPNKCVVTIAPANNADLDLVLLNTMPGTELLTKVAVDMKYTSSNCVDPMLGGRRLLYVGAMTIPGVTVSP
jgi:hypothetical protein